MIKIKPHHFMDIIKLYGKGIEMFIPDDKYNHNFYYVANEIIKNHHIHIKITLEQDDICLPCKYLGKEGRCIDTIDHINDVSFKNEWNQIIDNRIIENSNVLANSIHSAHEYCKILYSVKENIFDVWKEETNSDKYDRYNYFCLGAEKYLGIL